MTIRLVLVDDQPLVRMGFRMVLEATGDIQVIGEAGDGAMGVERTLALQPDVVLMDIRMPVLDGIGAIERGRGAGPGRPLSAGVNARCNGRFRA